MEDKDGDSDEMVSEEQVDEATKGAQSEANPESEVKYNFAPLTAVQMAGGVVETRKVAVPAHRYTPLRENWMRIYEPLVTQMKLQVRMNPRTRNVELRTSPLTDDAGALQKSADFVRAFMLGFAIEDAIALLRMDELYIDSFQIEDVKSLKGDHLSRAIGRISGKDGKTKFTIENATRTRIVVADRNIHILGAFNNIKVARDAICSLILGSPPGKVYAKLRVVSQRLNERF